MRKKKPEGKTEPTVAGILGVGLDDAGGHTRVTRSEEMLLVGGSQPTHERMQETAIRFSEALEKRGKALHEVPARDALAMLREAVERVGEK